MEDLNRDNIAQIAREVMGWVEYENPYTRDHSGWGTTEEKVVSSFDPYTNGSDTFLVIEKMREKGYVIEISSDVGGSYYVIFYKPKDDGEWFGNVSLKEAICNAALAAAKGNAEESTDSRWMDKEIFFPSKVKGGE